MKGRRRLHILPITLVAIVALVSMSAISVQPTQAWHGNVVQCIWDFSNTRGLTSIMGTARLGAIIALTQYFLAIGYLSTAAVLMAYSVTGSIVFYGFTIGWYIGIVSDCLLWHR